ncbi:hypothetical protein [Vibrio sp. SCSIO 43137]|uniref:hypothetical protein n=1 Tax=Vibrio sp. SCSIO 43137 TaxID=3021011 RepID=UPI002306F55F|nr:hypothetical protein [Vibrio sp. SCSIO 43137]WCE32069.1 hypothetical protein PK654_16310 [Vibrio sp. SCSIO 43137]
MTTSKHSDFYLQVEDFILNATTNSLGEISPQENEIRIFLLTLLNHFKYQDKE